MQSEALDQLDAAGPAARVDVQDRKHSVLDGEIDELLGNLLEALRDLRQIRKVLAHTQTAR